MGLIKKIQNAVRNRTTYRSGLLQARVYRALKTYTGEKLSAYGISTIDWALLGIVYDRPEGIRANALADELGVEAPFITVLFGKLKKMGILDSKVDLKDSRAKNIFVTPKGKLFIPKVEATLYQELKVLIEDISASEMLTYITVLEQINENSKKITIKNSRHSYY